MPKKYPPLTPREVIQILKALEFDHKRTTGDHEHYEKRHSGKRHLVTVDTGANQFDAHYLKSIISQSGYSRNQFYGATPRTAKKIQ